MVSVPILDVSYEDLVADSESGARRILEFAGLPWDDRCLRFHENRRVVHTASIDQVRRPIYRSSSRFGGRLNLREFLRCRLAPDSRTQLRLRVVYPKERTSRR